MKSSIVRSGSNTFNIWIYGKGLIRAYIVSLLFFLISAIIITYTKLGEGVIPILTSIIMVVSIAYAAIYVSVHIKKRGWLHGAFIGLLYILFLIILSKIFITDFVMDKVIYYRILTCTVTGGIGGMIGINMK
ncbi:putative membrane protein, TIGR04086 family [Natronincola peptidivorans]|uniref:Putative membrane protein, TIGR04086 family n=1 Tax=Natronincola peptidivorans TaxID=426128 RepID=A0A1H9YX28_9FIRM|nr:TIGR04086 family membrane protein [Natronincola peptidivorans]SES73711.1 putative membrane protein, TIGR04086 family [Natronincola peptidivorans]